jgi:hypothetical protein
MRINLQLTFADKTEKEITANAADLVAFEDKFNLSIAALGGGEPRLSHLLYIAWHSETRTKGTNLSFEEWCSTVEAVGESPNDPK